jgi:hypothetical protein
MPGLEGKMRMRLILGKYPVVRIEKSPNGLYFALQLQEGIKYVVEVPATVDIREGDLLTLYTEVLCNPLKQ